MAVEQLTDMVRRKVAETGSTRDLALRMKDRFGWTDSDAAAVARTCQMLSQGQPERKLPADALPDVIRATRDASFLDYLMRVWWEVQQEDREDEPIREMRTVRRERRRGVA